MKESDWVGVKCKEYKEDDGYANTQECTFPNANLQQVYNFVKKINSNLKSELPVNDVEYPSVEGGCINVKYHYKTKKHLSIELLYEGDETYFEIIEKGNKTQSKITSSAD